MDKTAAVTIETTSAATAVCRCCGYEDTPSLGWSDNCTLCPACYQGPHDCPKLADEDDVELARDRILERQEMEDLEGPQDYREDGCGEDF